MSDLFDFDDFLGTGLTYAEWVAKMDYERYMATYEQQNTTERRRRWHYIHRLFEEHLRLCEEHGHRSVEGGNPKGFFGSAISTQLAIECIWSGDWKKLKDCIHWMSEDFMVKIEQEDADHARKWAGILATAREIAQEAYDTRPEGESRELQ